MSFFCTQNYVNYRCLEYFFIRFEMKQLACGNNNPSNILQWYLSFIISSKSASKEVLGQLVEAQNMTQKFLSDSPEKNF